MKRIFIDDDPRSLTRLMLEMDGLTGADQYSFYNFGANSSRFIHNTEYYCIVWQELNLLRQ